MAVKGRVLIGKIGLDGHDRGAKVVARGLRDAGFEVVYSGLHQTPEMIANAAVQEDVDVIGISILSGAHNTLIPALMKSLAEKDAADISIVVGGIIPDDDIATLKSQGVEAVFLPGVSLKEIVETLEAIISKKKKE